MAWLDKEVIPQIRDEKELWAVCPKCHAHFPRAEYPKGLAECPSCGAPARMGCRERIASLADGAFEEIGADVGIFDHLGFADASGTYAAKAAAAAAKTGLSESIVAGVCSVEGRQLVLCVMDFRFFGGSLGSGTGTRIVLAAEEAMKRRLPLVIFCASGGARMQEGIVSLMQMARTCAAIEALRAEGLPYLSVLTDPTTGGVSASYALIADIVIAEPRALIGFAGRRVIENTIRQKLPDDFQTAEYLLDHGFVDAIVPRADLRRFLAETLSFWRPQSGNAPSPQPGAQPSFRPGPSVRAWDKVLLARAPGRPTIRDYISLAFDSFTELHGDRLCGDDRALIGGLASIGGAKVMLIGHQKGKTAGENAACNFGMANPEGYRKALRLMRLAEAWGLPVVSLVDTAGAYPGLEAEARGQAEAIGRNLAAMARLRTPIISVITGEGGSGGAIGIAAGDRVMMLENAIYSVISPEGCAAILWKDGKFAPEAAEALKITACDLLSLGGIDGIVPEPEGGAQANPAAAAANIRTAILDAIFSLKDASPDTLIANRIGKYAGMGAHVSKNMV